MLELESTTQQLLFVLAEQSFAVGFLDQLGDLIAVIDAADLALGRYAKQGKYAARLLEGGKWGLVGGFMERDETLIQAVAREVLEETGWQITDITLFSIVDNPNRPHEDRQNVAFIYFATATEKTGQADDESDEQRWFEFSKLPPPNQIAFDHLESIKLYQKHRVKSFPLPILE